MSARTKARKRALDILFQSDIRGDALAVTLASEATRAANEPSREASWLYAREIVDGVIDNQDEIDEQITTFAKDWSLARMPAVDRALLRMAVWEILYNDGEGFVFMDVADYDQITVGAATVGDAANFLLENQQVQIALNNGNPLYVELPASVILEITYTEPGLQGDRSSAGTKAATVETGYEIQVPLFVEQGTKVKVHTRTGDYLGRVN